MDQELLVESRIQAGRRLLVEFVREGLDVSAAAWIQYDQDGSWYLYVGSSAANGGKIADAYRTVYSCLTRLPDLGIDFSDIKILPTSAPVVEELVSRRDRRPGWQIQPSFGGKRLVGEKFDQAYVYPQITKSLTRDEVIHAVTHLIDRKGAINPSTITLRNGTVIRGFPFGIEMKRQNGLPSILETKLIDSADGSTQIIPVDEVASIQ